MIDRELLESIGQLLDMKLTNELSPLKYEVNSIKEEVKIIKEEVKTIRNEAKAGRDETKSCNDKVDAIEKRLKKFETLQEIEINGGIKRLLEQQRETLDRFQKLDEMNEKISDIQGAVEVLKVLSAKKS